MYIFCCYNCCCYCCCCCSLLYTCHPRCASYSSSTYHQYCYWYERSLLLKYTPRQYSRFCAVSAVLLKYTPRQYSRFCAASAIPSIISYLSSTIRACAKPQAGVSPPRRSPPCSIPAFICIYPPTTCISAAAALCVAILPLRSLLVQCWCWCALRHRVPGDTMCCCGLLHLIPVFYFSSSKHELFLMYPLTVLSACTASIYLSYKYYTSSLITGMRGAKAGVGPPRRSPPCILRYILYTQTSCRWWYGLATILRDKKLNFVSTAAVEQPRMW